MSQTATHARISASGARQGLTGVAAEANFIPKTQADGKIDGSIIEAQDILDQKFRADDYQPADLTAPAAASTLNVSPQLLGQEPGGGVSAEGVVTDAPNNVVRLLDDDSDEILDATENKVFGRLTVSQVALTGTLTFTNSVTTVTGVGTLFTTEIEVGDLIQLDADGQYAEVSTITDDFTLDLSAGYGGTGGAGAGTRRRFILTFLSNISGVETAYAGFSGGETLQWFALRAYTLFSLPVFPAFRVLPSDQLAGEVPDATETLAGKVVLAADGDTAAGEAVQGNDSRLHTSLGADEHTQYALLAGRTGGQTLVGGDAASDALLLRATSNGTPGPIVLETTPGTEAARIDAATGALLVGTTAPLAGELFRLAGDALLEGVLEHTGSTVGFFGSGPATQATAYTQTFATADKTHAARTAASLTDNSAGAAADGTIDAITDPADTPASADALRDDLVATTIPDLRNAITELADQVNKLVADQVDTAEVVNALVDDLQSYGLVL